jgi:hypothetical protein
MQSGRLRREKLVLFLSKRITTNAPASADKQLLADYYRRILHQFNEAFEQHRRVIASLFEPHGCRVTSMSTEDLFRYFALFLNPSYLKREKYDPICQFKPEETIHQNCWHQGVQAGRNFGFFADGYFHNLVILKRRPQRTRRGLFWALTFPPVPRLFDHRQSLSAQCPQGNRPHGKVPGTRAWRLWRGGQAFLAHSKGR